MSRLAATVLASAIAFASPAIAQDLYWGAGVGYSAGASDQVSGGSGSSDLSAGMLTLILGQRFAAGNGFWGWETSADLSFGAEAKNPANGVSCPPANGSYLCKHDATVRIVGLYGAPIGQGTELFGALGVGMMMGDYATDTMGVGSARTYGLTVGLGVNRDFGNGMTLRGEVIRDEFKQDTQEPYSSDYSGTSVRLALLRKF